MSNLIIVAVLVLGIIALGKILETVIETLLGIAGMLIVVYAAGVVAAVLINFVVGLPLVQDVLMSWIKVGTEVMALVCA